MIKQRNDFWTYLVEMCVTMLTELVDMKLSLFSGSTVHFLHDGRQSQSLESCTLIDEFEANLDNKVYKKVISHSLISAYKNNNEKPFRVFRVYISAVIR